MLILSIFALISYFFCLDPTEVIESGVDDVNNNITYTETLYQDNRKIRIYVIRAYFSKIFFFNTTYTYIRLSIQQ